MTNILLITIAILIVTDAIITYLFYRTVTQEIEALTQQVGNTKNGQVTSVEKMRTIRKEICEVKGELEKSTNALSKRGRQNLKEIDILKETVDRIEQLINSSIFRKKLNLPKKDTKTPKSKPEKSTSKD